MQTKNEKQENTQTIIRVNVEGTPFTVVKWENEWLVMLGDYVLLRGFISQSQATEAIEADRWTLIGAFTYAMIDNYMKNKAIEKKASENKNK